MSKNQQLIEYVKTTDEGGLVQRFASRHSGV